MTARGTAAAVLIAAAAAGCGWTRPERRDTADACGTRREAPDPAFQNTGEYGLVTMAIEPERATVEIRGHCYGAAARWNNWWDPHAAVPVGRNLWTVRLNGRIVREAMIITPHGESEVRMRLWRRPRR